MRQRQNQQKWGPPGAVKASCGADVRVVIVPSMISHKDLMTTLQRKFPDQSAFTVRFTDADGNSKPLNARADFAEAVVAANTGCPSDADDAFGSGGAGGSFGPGKAGNAGTPTVGAPLSVCMEAGIADKGRHNVASE